MNECGRGLFVAPQDATQTSFGISKRPPHTHYGAKEWQARMRGGTSCLWLACIHVECEKKRRKKKRTKKTKQKRKKPLQKSLEKNHARSFVVTKEGTILAAGATGGMLMILFVSPSAFDSSRWLRFFFFAGISWNKRSAEKHPRLTVRS